MVWFWLLLFCFLTKYCHGGGETSICNPKLFRHQKKQMTLYELNYLLSPVSINLKKKTYSRWNITEKAPLLEEGSEASNSKNIYFMEILEAPQLLKALLQLSQLSSASSLNIYNSVPVNYSHCPFCCLVFKTS